MALTRDEIIIALAALEHGTNGFGYMSTSDVLRHRNLDGVHRIALGVSAVRLPRPGREEKAGRVTGAGSRIVGHGRFAASGQQDDLSVNTSATKPSLWRALLCERGDLLFDPGYEVTRRAPTCRGGHREPQRHHDQQSQTSNCSREVFCFGESDVMWQITRGWSL